MSLHAVRLRSTLLVVEIAAIESAVRGLTAEFYQWRGALGCVVGGWAVYYITTTETPRELIGEPVPSDG